MNGVVHADGRWL